MLRIFRRPSAVGRSRREEEVQPHTGQRICRGGERAEGKVWNLGEKMDEHEFEEKRPLKKVNSLISQSPTSDISFSALSY